jgi:hypothetical protein
MSIVSSAVLEDTAQVDGRRSIRLQWVAHTGEPVIIGGLFPSDFDTAAALAAYEGDALATLMSWERDSIYKAILAGFSVGAVLGALDHLTVAQALKSLMRRLMRTSDPREIIALKPVALYINANFTDTQIRSSAGINQAQLNNYKARVSAVITDTGLTMEAQLAAMDSTDDADTWSTE